MSGGDSPGRLEPTPAERAGLTAEVNAMVESFLDGLTHSPASFGEADRSLIDELLTPPPETGGPLGPLLDTIVSASETGFDTAAGTHLSYIPSGGIYASALARFVGAALNRWTGASFASPGSVALEQSVINWMIELFGLGPSAAGVLLSGGSIANLEATIAARTRLGDRFDDGVVYASERAHHSVEKACRLAGLPSSAVRLVAVDEQLRMDAAALEAATVADRAQGLRPMMIVATAGTTDTGDIDPLDACADVAKRHGIWFHVDAAYGGFFVLTERGRSALAGIERADSITVDAHKSLLMPFGIGGLLVADGETLLQAHEGRGSYMQDVMDDPDLPHFFALSPELSRPYRGLELWLPLHLHGVAAFRSELDRMLDLAEGAAERLRHLPGIELAVEPALSIVSFRSTDGDERSKQILDEVNASAEVHLSSTTVADRFTIRLAFLNHRTTAEIADRAVELVALAAGAAEA